MNLHAEWLEADGLGGFASGTIGGIRTRRYHALLSCALSPPTGRHVLVDGFDAFVEAGGARFALTSQKYAPDVVAPDGGSRLVAYENEPWPTFTFQLENGAEIVQEICAVRDAPVVVVTWRMAKPPKKARGAGNGRAPVTLQVRPFLSGRDHHAFHRENPWFRFDADVRESGARDSRVGWRPYESLPGVASLANGAYRHEPHWYRNFACDEEAARGFDARNDLGSPGELAFDLGKGEACWILGAELSLLDSRQGPAALARKLRAAERARRAKFPTPLQRAGDAFLARRGAGLTIVAGYPWFTDWGRDTFIALRGLCLATGRRAEARSILLQWADAVSDGMVPNRFPDGGAPPEYNTSDASLWFVVAVEELLAAAPRGRGGVTRADEKKLLAAVQEILEHHAAGARFNIRMDEDALLTAGEPGQQLTWMDARAGGREVTSRIGKAVEIQALWFNALSFAARKLEDRASYRHLAARVRSSFLDRFWNEEAGCLHDVVDSGHVRGAVDSTIRPNQILAIGGLPRALLAGPRARRVVDLVERRLWTPLGLRSLAPDDPAYCPRYEGGPVERDTAYHQGTAWPWLIGPFAEAWARVRGDTAAARREALARFVQPLLDRMAENGVPHLCEISDGDPPHGWRGCPMQAWSLGEVLRLAPRAKLAAPKAKARGARG